MPLIVKLKCVPNPDRDRPFRPYGGDVEVASIEEARTACMEFIRRHDLGGGNWAGGQVFEDGRQIASISYNGRIWPCP